MPATTAQPLSGELPMASKRAAKWSASTGALRRIATGSDGLTVVDMRARNQMRLFTAALASKGMQRVGSWWAVAGQQVGSGPGHLLRA